MTIGLLVVAAACSSDSGSTKGDAAGETTDTPPFEYAGATAALGDDGDLVVLDEEPVDELVTAGNVAYALTSVEDDPTEPPRYRNADIRPIDLPE